MLSAGGSRHVLTRAVHTPQAFGVSSSDAASKELTEVIEGKHVSSRHTRSIGRAGFECRSRLQAQQGEATRVDAQFCTAHEQQLRKSIRICNR